MVPPGAVTQDTEITVEALDASDPDLPDLGSGLSRVFRFGPPGQQFNQPATIVLSYLEAEAAGAIEGELTVCVTARPGGPRLAVRCRAGRYAQRQLPLGPDSSMAPCQRQHQGCRLPHIAGWSAGRHVQRRFLPQHLYRWPERWDYLHICGADCGCSRQRDHRWPVGQHHHHRQPPARFRRPDHNGGARTRRRQ